MMGIRVQFLTFEGCPLADAARVELEAALETFNVREYEEIDILDPMAPEELRGWGSPTILVDGLDLGGLPKGDGTACRIYPGKREVPSKDEIIAAIKARGLD